MKMKVILRAILVAVAGISAIGSQAQTEAVKAAFKAVPADVAPLMSEYAKLDMIDYFESGMDTPTANVLDGQMRITDLTPDHLGAELGTVHTLDIYLLPTANDTLALYISTLAVPVKDATVNVVRRDSVDVTSRVFKAPAFREWLTPQGRKERKYVESELPYIGIGYTYSPSTGILTLTPEYPATLSREVMEKLEPMLLGQLRYKWTGKKFAPLK